MGHCSGIPDRTFPSRAIHRERTSTPGTPACRFGIEKTVYGQQRQIRRCSDE